MAETNTYLIIGVAVACIIFTILVVFFMYRHYSAGQSTCAALYPGGSLQDLRLREECKDRKRRAWAMPAAAMLV